MSMLSEKYEMITRNSEMAYAVEQGEARGIVETLLELNFTADQIVQKLMEKLHLKEVEAQSYLNQ